MGVPGRSDRRVINEAASQTRESCRFVRNPCAHTLYVCEALDQCSDSSSLRDLRAMAALKTLQANKRAVRKAMTTVLRSLSQPDINAQCELFRIISLRSLWDCCSHRSRAGNRACHQLAALPEQPEYQLLSEHACRRTQHGHVGVRDPTHGLAFACRAV